MLYLSFIWVAVVCVHSITVNDIGVGYSSGSFLTAMVPIQT